MQQTRQPESNIQHARRVTAIVGHGGGSQYEEPEPHIAASWKRCLTDYGLDPASPHDQSRLDQSALGRRQEALGELHQIAQAEMESLHRQISGSGYVILLTDARGLVTNCVADDALQRDLTRAGVVTGSEWSEEREGTNGMGTCLVEQRPIIVHRDDHFWCQNTALTCSAAPIFDSQGRLAAVLDASSLSCRDSKQSQYHTMALLNMSAKLIENRNFLSRHRDSKILCFHARREFLGALAEAMLAMDAEGRTIGANANAAARLGIHHGRLLGRPVEELLDVSPFALEDWAVHQPYTVRELHQIPRGQRFFAQLRPPQKGAAGAQLAAHRARTRSTEPRQRHGALNLERLAGADPALRHTVRCIRRVLDRDINVMLCGETGTGKEAFAQAIHRASPRASWPFVALNCASIPETLIESELFGYRRGAFTGARREGMRGKVLQADGGTLFLDEIGDMPLDLQPRLLRVLEEREVQPLGADAPIAVQLHVISASHYDLREQVRRGLFREDLFYRLNGLMVTLPALKERKDRLDLVNQILDEENDARGSISLDPVALQRLLEYAWPGNIRELRNALRTATALCDDGVIRLQDLPHEIARLDLAPDGDPQRDLLAERGTSLESAERDALVEELERNRWNITSTAANLKMSRSTVYRKLKKHGIC